MIREVQVADVSGGLPSLLEAVARGETVVIKQGATVLARMTPEPQTPRTSSVLNWYKRPVLVASGPILVDGEEHDPPGSARCSCSQCFAAAAMAQ